MFFSLEARPTPKLDSSVIEHYKAYVSFLFFFYGGLSSLFLLVLMQMNTCISKNNRMGKLLSTYTSGTLPKGFIHIPVMSCWEEVLYLTEPEKWSPAAIYQATRIFASNMISKRAKRFYKLVLLPRVREDIRKHKRLHFKLFQTLKKALYKPAAFNKGILFPLFKVWSSLKSHYIVI